MQQQEINAEKSLKIFAFAALIIQVIVMGFMCLVQVDIGDIDGVWIDMNIFILVGFGFFIAYIKGYSYSAILYVFFINALVFELNIIFSEAFQEAFGQKHQCLDKQKDICLDQLFVIDSKSIANASYGVFAVLIAFTGVFGKVGPLQMLILSVLGSIGYTLNQAIILATDSSKQLHFGNANIYIFGACYGIVINIFMSRKTGGFKQIQTTYVSLIMSVIGGMVLWLYWPSFNSANYLNFQEAEKDNYRSKIIINTIFSLCGSCMGAFAMVSCLHDKYNVKDLVLGSISGGIIISSPAIYIAGNSQIGISILFGFLTGLISTLMYIKINESQCCNCLNDIFGLLSIFLIPGMMSHILTWVITVTNTYQQGVFKDHDKVFPFTNLGISFGIALMFGILTGAIMCCTNSLDNQSINFEPMYIKVPYENQKQEQENPSEDENENVGQVHPE